MQHSEVGYDKTLGLIAKRLREDSDQVTHEPLPALLVDLLLHLDEQERRTSAGSQPAACEQLPVIEAGLLASNQEKVQRELIRAEEPTDDRGSSQRNASFRSFASL
jgi:hypothetical protein